MDLSGNRLIMLLQDGTDRHHLPGQVPVALRSAQASKKYNLRLDSKPSVVKEEVGLDLS